MADDIRRQAAELAVLAPDVLVAATGTATVAPLLQATRTVSIVFVGAGKTREFLGFRSFE